VAPDRGERLQATTVLDGLRYAEGLRWHDGALWVSDMVGNVVVRWDAGAGATVVTDAVRAPSGIGFSGDDAFVVSRDTDTLCRVGPAGVATAVDLAGAGALRSNDLVAAGDGWAYVGCLGAPYEAGDESRDWGDDAPGKVLLVPLGPAGARAHVVARGMACPNGMVLSPDGRTLLVSETYRRRVVAFERAADGALGDPRAVVEFPTWCDGMATDHAGWWIALTDSGQLAHATWDGVVDRVVTVGEPGEWAIDCTVGGEDDGTLFAALTTMTMAGLAAGTTTSRIGAIARPA
jgi:sugar lactone lactonase YvrE